MTPNEFVLWFKGFAQAASSYTLTPYQWDTVKEQLDKVGNENPFKKTEYILGGNIATTSTGKITDTTYKQDELSTNTIF